MQIMDSRLIITDQAGEWIYHFESCHVMAAKVRDMSGFRLYWRDKNSLLWDTLHKILEPV